MKRRLLIVLLTLSVLAIGLVIWHGIADRRARYQGKHIRDWALQLNATYYEPTATNAAAAAFQTMGTAALPTLIPLVNARDPLPEKIVLKYARYLPARFRSYLFKKVRPGRTIEYRLGAIRALGVLGPAAIPALPVMLEALHGPEPNVRWAAAQGIARLGPEAVAALIPLTTNTDVNLLHAVIYALGEAQTNAVAAVPALIRCSLDPNDGLRDSTLYSLSRIGPAGVPQALAIAATNKDSQLQNAAFRSLVALRPPPDLVLTSRLVISTNTPEVRQLALRSLWFSRQTNEHAWQLYRASLNDEDATVRDTAQKIIDRLNTTNRSRRLPL